MRERETQYQIVVLAPYVNVVPEGYHTSNIESIQMGKSVLGILGISVT